MKKLMILLLMVCSYCVFSQPELPIPKPKITVKKSSTIIENQEWTTSNLSVKKFANGDEITQVSSQAEWDLAWTAKTPVWCYYNFDASNSKYGKIYNYFAVQDSRKLAPKGWHIPSQAEWDTLKSNLGDSAVFKMRKKAGKYWIWDKNKCWEGIKSDIATNESGFDALPGGGLIGVFPEANQKTWAVGYFAIWWASDKTDPVDYPLSHHFCMTICSVGSNDDCLSIGADKAYGSTKNGYYVRCVKNYFQIPDKDNLELNKGKKKDKK